MPFEPQFPSPYSSLFHGDMQAVVLDPHGLPASTIISLKDDFHLKVSWQVDGTLVPLITGKWLVQAFLEAIGPGPEVPLFAEPKKYEMGKKSYSDELIIHPATLGLTPGPYKLVTILTSTDSLKNPAPFAGYIESPMLQFYMGESLEGQ